MNARRLALAPWCAIVLALAAVPDGYSSVKLDFRESRSTTHSLRTIAAWIEQSGVAGAMGAEVADALDILRMATEHSVEAKQRAFQSGDTLHLAQVSADERREFLLFLVKQPNGQLFFYLSTVNEGFKRAFVSIPEQDLVVPLDAATAERGFQNEIRYWEGIISTR